MALVQFRGLSSGGINPDPGPYDLGLNAWSSGANVRFHANKAERAPVFKTVRTLGSEPLFATAFRPASVGDMTFYVSADSITRSLSTTVVDVTPSAGVAFAAGQAFTASNLGDVLYLNHPTGIPLYFGPQSSAFSPLPGWDPSWSCRSLRTFGDFVVALGVAKGSQTVPQMFKWSDLTLAGQAPASWDADDPTTNAGENVIEDLTSPIVDGCALKNTFIVYSSDQAIQVSQTGDQMVFSFQRLGIDGGLIAPNCVVEQGGVHYCFGQNDIYVNDTLSQVSLADGTVRDFIYSTLDRRRAEACFVVYSPAHKEVLFCYPTTDPAAAFQGPSGCNRAAVYSLTSKVWSFIDLPNVTAGFLVSLDQGTSYADLEAAGTTFGGLSGSYLSLRGAHDDNVLFASQSGGSITKPRLLAYDFANKAAATNFTAEPECNAPAYLQRIGLDLDTQGSDLTTYKNIRRVYPQTTIFAATPVTITVGGSLTPSGAVSWGAPVTFDPTTQYKIDTMAGGRYVSYRFEVSSPVDFEVLGFDADVTSAGRR